MEAIVIFEDQEFLGVTRLAAQGFKTERFDILLQLINALLKELQKEGGVL